LLLDYEMCVRYAVQALEALASLSVPQATVIRDGLEDTLDAKDLVPGDIVVLDEGMSVPADLRLVRAFACLFACVPRGWRVRECWGTRDGKEYFFFLVVCRLLCLLLILICAPTR
jgi:hypothetical protein